MGEPLRGSFGYGTIGLSGAIPPPKRQALAKALSSSIAVQRLDIPAVLILRRIALCFAAQGDKGTCDGSEDREGTSRNS